MELPAAGPSIFLETLVVSGLSFTSRSLPSSLGRLLSSLACSVAGRCRSAAVGMACSRCGKRSQSCTPSPSDVRAPSPLRSFEVGLRGAAEQQMDPFECCSVNPCACCAFYKSRWWGTTSAVRSSRLVSGGSDGSPASSGSPSRRSTARRGGARSDGDSNKPSTDSSSDESAPITPVRFPCPTPLEFRLDHTKCVRSFFFR